MSNSHLEEISSDDGVVLALVIRKGFKKDGINFVSQPTSPLQLGVNSYKKGDTIKSHVHKDIKITITKLQEMLYIKSGKAVVNLYTPNRKLFKSFDLSAGDLIFLIDGGHGLEMVEDTTIIEVKQGPYLGKNHDKILIE